MSDTNTSLAKLVEVETPFFGARLFAPIIGTLQLTLKEFQRLTEEKEEFVDMLSDDDIAAVLGVFDSSVVDPAYLLSQIHIFPADTYDDVRRLYEALVVDVSSLDNQKRWDIFHFVSSHLDILLEDVLDSFHRCYESLTVFITDDGRIAIGEWVEN